MENLIRKFKNAYPKAFFLDDDVRSIQIFLQERDWIELGEIVKSASKAGEGNMNKVLRIATNRRTFILKQSRPWVEKYPQIEAPIERSAVEFQFYFALLTNKQIQKHVPQILNYSEEDFTIMFQDLGEGKDLSFVYAESGSLMPWMVEGLAQYLKALHGSKVETVIPNRHMRELNHFHIFVLPFQEDNGFDLDHIAPGLAELGREVRESEDVMGQIKKLGERYLEDGDVLVHGDFYPGSALLEGQRIYVIDPEFAFPGFAEWDLGVLYAHLLLAQQEDALWQLFLQTYGNERIDMPLVHQVAGVEILRRILGVAQLNLPYEIDTLSDLIHHAMYLLRSSS